MLRITTQTDAVQTRLLLEGQLTGPWVEELSRCWSAVTASQRTQPPVTVDLRGVSYIDASGKALLAQMCEQGARFEAIGCMTRSIVEEISNRQRSSGCGPC